MGVEEQLNELILMIERHEQLCIKLESLRKEQRSLIKKYVLVRARGGMMSLERCGESACLYCMNYS